MSNLNKEQCEMLVLAAKDALKNAYAPYSRYYVGAALLTESGKVYTGCNIENRAHTPTCCAERTAFFKAVSEGERAFSAIAVAGGLKGEISGYFPPCGVCRQVMSEFCEADKFTIILVEKNSYKVMTLEEIFPFGFSKDYVK